MWIREEAAKLTDIGINFGLTEAKVPPRTIVLKAANSRLSGELVVWENGATSMTVLNLETENYDLDRHDTVIGDENFESELRVFFDTLKKK